MKYRPNPMVSEPALDFMVAPSDSAAEFGHRLSTPWLAALARRRRVRAATAA